MRIMSVLLSNKFIDCSGFVPETFPDIVGLLFKFAGLVINMCLSSSEEIIPKTFLLSINFLLFSQFDVEVSPMVTSEHGDEVRSQGSERERENVVLGSSTELS